MVFRSSNMMRQLLVRTTSNAFRQVRHRSYHLDDLDELMTEDRPLESAYPNLQVDPTIGLTQTDITAKNIVVIQPWNQMSKFCEYTDADLQLAECVSLGNTIKNWNVVGKKILYGRFFNRKHLVGPDSFEALKGEILSYPGVNAVFFGVDSLSAVQLFNLEKDLGVPVYDRFTIVLNIFRQHARSKAAKIQIALAELPYIKAHLKEIHESADNLASTESLKLYVGGLAEKNYRKRCDILKQREKRLKQILLEIQKDRELTKKERRKTGFPTISVVGYTNSGKTTLIKTLTEDSRLEPKDQLFATLDVSSHLGCLPSCKDVYFIDTVGFLSRIPNLLIEAFSETLRDVCDSDLIIHILDVTHPDHALQYRTVVDALNSLKVGKNLIKTMITVANKADLLEEGAPLPDTMPKFDLKFSATKLTNMDHLIKMADERLMGNLSHEFKTVRASNGGPDYVWLRKNATIRECTVDPDDGNQLICRVVMNPATAGKWRKMFEMHAD